MKSPKTELVGLRKLANMLMRPGGRGGEPNGEKPNRWGWGGLGWVGLGWVGLSGLGGLGCVRWVRVKKMDGKIKKSSDILMKC